VIRSGIPITLSVYIISSLLDYMNCFQDTFRGRVCECPVVDGVQYKGDGYTSCKRMFLNLLFLIYLIAHFCSMILTKFVKQLMDLRDVQ